jgi:hypothetical protein
MEIQEACCCGGNGMQQSQSEHVLYQFLGCVFSPFFFVEEGVTGQVYLKMLQNWSMPQVTEEKFTFQHDGAPSHWHMVVQKDLNGKPTRSKD